MMAELLAGNIFWNGGAFSPAGSFTVALMCMATVLSFRYIVSSNTSATPRSLKDGKEYPPYAPGGMWKHIQIATSGKYPWWILDVATQLNTRVFQLSLPLKFGRRNFVVGELATFRNVLTDPLTEKPLDVYSRFKNVNGGWPTMLTLNGSAWHSKRKAAAPAFSSNQVKRMNMLALEKTEDWIRETLTKEHESFNVAKEIIGVVLSAISETAFEYQMSKEEKEYFGEELELASIEFFQKSSSGPLRNMFGWFIPSRRRAFVAAKNLREFVLKIMNEYRKKEDRTDGTIIQLIMESDAFLTDYAKAAELLEFLIAGHETTGFSISWILICLARNKSEQSKLRRSLSELSPDNWSRSQELQCVVKEGMRLYPATAGGSVRTTGRDIVTSQNQLIPKGSVCFLPVMLLFRNPDVFENPDLFLPSRWEKPTRDQLDSFQPFSMGKQNCIGQTLARAEIFALVARIISEFELSEDESRGKFTVDFFLTLKPVGAFLKARRV